MGVEEGGERSVMASVGDVIKVEEGGVGELHHSSPSYSSNTINFPFV